MGVTPQLVETRLAYGGPRFWRSACWHLFGHRPSTAWRLEEQVSRTVDQFRPDLLLTTGVSPLGRDILRTASAAGARTANYLTDDPWNPGLRSDRFLHSLSGYDVVFTPRRANLGDLSVAGARRVEYLPFGYDPRFVSADGAAAGIPCDVLFVGGADGDRVQLIAALVRGGLDVAVHGEYWGRYPETRGVGRGHVAPRELVRATRAAKVCLILVRRANRDGHVMRTFEAAATGGCLLVEDTAEHRAIFGADGECVRYFDTPVRLVAEAKRLVDSPGERERLADAVRRRVTTGKHTYADRLRTILGRVGLTLPAPDPTESDRVDVP